LCATLPPAPGELGEAASGSKTKDAEMHSLFRANWRCLYPRAEGAPPALLVSAEAAVSLAEACSQTRPSRASPFPPPLTYDIATARSLLPFRVLAPFGGGKSSFATHLHRRDHARARARAMRDVTSRERKIQNTARDIRKIAVISRISRLMSRGKMRPLVQGGGAPPATPIVGRASVGNRTMGARCAYTRRTISIATHVGVSAAINKAARRWLVSRRGWKSRSRYRRRRVSSPRPSLSLFSFFRPPGIAANSG